LLCFQALSQANSVKFLYIEAGEGNSSGGHVGLQLNDAVYHYQHDEGYLRLFRHDAKVFLDHYRFEENRNVHVADLDVSQTAFADIQGFFQSAFFAQKQRLNYLEAVNNDITLLKLMLNQTDDDGNREWANSLQLPGAGFFYDDRSRVKQSFPRLKTSQACSLSTTSFSAVKRAIEDKYGQGFLVKRSFALRGQLVNLMPEPYPSANADYRYRFSQRYRDELNGLLALQAIQNDKALTSRACFVLDDTAKQLTPPQIARLQAFQLKLQDSIVSLIESHRPDWGYALFVMLARYKVIQASIQSRQWHFLDDTQSEALNLSSNQLRFYADALQKQRQKAVLNFRKTLSRLENLDDLNEYRYTSLEQWANRLRQWRLGEGGQPLLYRKAMNLPNKQVALSSYIIVGKQLERLNSALTNLNAAYENMQEEHRRQQRYRLIDHNCVTALLSALDQAVKGDSRQRLGGYVDPVLTVVPFVSFDAVVNRYKVKSTSLLPSYRNQMLANMYQTQASEMVYARESNVLTSSLYHLNDKDAWFVFFTDDQVLPRPVFGAVNMVAAISQSLFGLAKLPIDQGHELTTGLKGLLASFPELVFFNIRKGSYPLPLKFEPF
jgi:hypothetical protein